MKNALNPQEIYLLERYISLEYFSELRETWEKMIRHIESCLENFMMNLPRDYRSRPVPEQPDIVWGHRVLPNFRNTLQGLNSGFILLTHGDYKGLSHASGPISDFKGQSDYWTGWMERTDENLYGELLNKAVMLASNISRTERAGWEPFDLINYCDQWGPLDPPLSWPGYRVNKAISVKAGAKIELEGLYQSDLDSSCAEFLSSRYDVAPAAKVLVSVKDPSVSKTSRIFSEDERIEDKSCTWYLVERDSDFQLNSQHAVTNMPGYSRLEAGETCLATGFYFTPAKSDSRRLFEKGDVMPSVDTGYGQTIWQWDENQDA